MDRFIELQKDIENKYDNYQKVFAQIKKELKNTQFESIEKIYNLSEKLKKYASDLSILRGQYKRFLSEDDNIYEMLNGYHRDEDVWNSFIYFPIVYYEQAKKYVVEDKYFDTLKEAMDYSMSFGIREDWKKNAYMYL